MTVKVKTWYVTAALVVLTALLSWLVIYLNSERKSALNLVNAQQGVISEYSIDIDYLKEKVYETELVVVSREKELNLSKEQKERLKKQHVRDVKVIAELELQIKALHDSLILKHGVDTIDVEFMFTPEDTIPVVRVPVSFSWSDEWASSWGSINIKGLGTSGFEVKSLPLDIVLGSRGVFNKRYISAASSPSPYVHVSENNVQLVQKKSRGVMVVTTSAVIGGILGFILGAL